MKKLALLIALLLISSMSFAFTIINSDVIVNTTWNSGGSPYIVIANVAVTAHLTITLDTNIIFIPGGYIKFTSGSQLTSIGTGADPIVWEGIAPNSWGGAFFEDAVVRMDYNRVLNAKGNGSGALNFFRCPSVEITRSYFKGNTYNNILGDDIGGGAISAKECEAVAVVECGFEYNIFCDPINENGDLAGGSAIATYNVKYLKIISNKFNNHKCDWTGTVFVQHEGDTPCQNDVIDNYFENCHVGLARRGTHHGGAIAMYIFRARTISKFEVNKNTVVKCTSTESGGAIYVETKECLTTPIKINKNTVKDNRATKYGGGICAFEADYSHAIDWEIYENEAYLNAPNNPGELVGGGIAVHGHRDSPWLVSNIHLKGNKIYENTADSGGGLFIHNKVFVEKCKINDNKARYGGGVYLSNAWSEINDYIMVDSDIFSNEAEKGGGVYSRQNLILHQGYKYVNFEGNENTTATPGPAFYAHCGTSGSRNDKLDVFFGDCLFEGNIWPGRAKQVAKFVYDLADFPLVHTPLIFDFYNCTLQFGQADYATHDHLNNYDPDPFNIIPIWATD